MDAPVNEIIKTGCKTLGIIDRKITGNSHNQTILWFTSNLNVDKNKKCATIKT